jgi:integrase
MPRRPVGVFGRRVFVRVNGTLKSKQFPPGTPTAVLVAWRDTQRNGRTRRRSPIGGSCEDAVDRYLALPAIAAQAYVHQKAHALDLWLAELGRDRPLASVTRDEIEVVLLRWLRTLKPATVYHRRTALLSLFVTLHADTPDAPNPVKGTTCPASWTPTDQSVPIETLRAILAAMPNDRWVKRGIRQPSAAKLVATVLIETGVRGVDWSRVRRTDVHLAEGYVTMPATTKGKGAPSWRLTLTPEAVAAVQAFDAANLYGAFDPEAVSHSFKRAVRTVLGDDSPVHLYSGRHSVGADLYAATGDLATVGRLLGHRPGSRATAQYARGGNDTVDAAAVAKLSAGRARGNTPPPVVLHLPVTHPRKRRSA